MGQPSTCRIGRAEVNEVCVVCSGIALVAEAGRHHVAHSLTQATGGAEGLAKDIVLGERMVGAP